VGRRRQLGALTQQAKDYIASASESVAAELRLVLTQLEDAEVADDISFPAIEHGAQFGRNVILLSNGHVLVWLEFVDAPARHKVFYIGPARLF